MYAFVRVLVESGQLYLRVLNCALLRYAFPDELACVIASYLDNVVVCLLARDPCISCRLAMGYGWISGSRTWMPSVASPPSVQQ